MRHHHLFVAAALLPITASGATEPKAGKADQARPAALVRLVNCRTKAAVMDRLACYEKEVAAIDAAEARKDLVIVDREQLRSTRRTLFGLVLPNLSVFGDNNDDRQQVTQLEAKIRSASQNPYGKWTLTLEDGARWAQSDSRNLSIEPRPGQTVKIRRAAMGTYFANVAGQVAIRVHRLR